MVWTTAAVSISRCSVQYLVRLLLERQPDGGTGASGRRRVLAGGGVPALLDLIASAPDVRERCPGGAAGE